MYQLPFTDEKEYLRKQFKYSYILAHRCKGFSPCLDSSITMGCSEAECHDSRIM